MRRRSEACVLVVALALTATRAHAQQVPHESAPPAAPTIAAVRLGEGETLLVDGVLDEAAWARAVPATDVKQRDPRPGAPATERTEMRVLIDATRLMLGVTCFDSEPARILANQMQRDQSFSGDDRFLWVSTRISTGAPATSSRSTPLAPGVMDW